jgi:hypothetical protein
MNSHRKPCDYPIPHELISTLGSPGVPMMSTDAVVRKTAARKARAVVVGLVFGTTLLATSCTDGEPQPPPSRTTPVSVASSVRPAPSTVPIYTERSRTRGTPLPTDDPTSELPTTELPPTPTTELPPLTTTTAPPSAPPPPSTPAPPGEPPQ